MIPLKDIEAAAGRIAGHIRRTPLLAADCLNCPVTGASLFLKLELLQPTGSFKARGAMNKVLTMSPDELSRGLVTASGGNHGLAIARAGKRMSVPAKIFLPSSVAPEKLRRFAGWGAGTEVVEGTWDAADEAARAFAARTGASYVHPFADPLVAAGQGTIGLELLEDLPELDVVIIAIGGGGLISGLGSALKALRPSIRVVGVEPTGSPTLRRSLDAGHVVTLPEITTKVATMACRRTDEMVFQTVAHVADDVVLIEDADMQRAAEWLWFEFGLAADLSGAAAVAALQSGQLVLEKGVTAAALVSGAGPDRIGCTMAAAVPKGA